MWAIAEIRHRGSPSDTTEFSNHRTPCVSFQLNHSKQEQLTIL